MFASIISCFKLSKTALKAGKAKDVVGNDKKVILCNKHFGNYRKLNTVIGPKAEDITFKVQID